MDEITDTNPIMNTDCLKEHHVKECSIISEKIELLKKERKKEIQECIFLEVNPNDSVYFDNKIQEEEKKLDRIKEKKTARKTSATTKVSGIRRSPRKKRPQEEVMQNTTLSKKKRKIPAKTGGASIKKLSYK